MSSNGGLALDDRDISSPQQAEQTDAHFVSEQRAATVRSTSSSLSAGNPKQRQQILDRTMESFGDGEWSQFLAMDDADASSVGVSVPHQQRLTMSSQSHRPMEQQPQQQLPDDPRNMIIELPPQLHPAVSAGMRRLTSCYFSVHSSDNINNNNFGDNNSITTAAANLQQCGSLADLLSLLDDGDPRSATATGDGFSVASSSCHAAFDTMDGSMLYHDLLMNIFAYLDTNSLAAFSETARRPNFEVFYYLQLQLQQSLLPSSSSSQNSRNIVHGLTPIAGTGRLVRLARTEPKAAEQVVQGYLDSNATLRQMPLSHSLEYIRQLLMRNHHHPSAASAATIGASQSTTPQQQTNSTQDGSLFSGAALLVALIGAASLTMNSEAMMSTSMDAFMPHVEDMPNMLFRVGFVGSLMSAARSFASSSTKDERRNSNPAADMKHRAALMKQQAEDFARNMMHTIVVLLEEGATTQQQQQQPTGVRSLVLRMVRAAYTTAYGQHMEHSGDGSMRRQSSFLFSPNPYEHLPPEMGEAEEEKEAAAGEEKEESKIGELEETNNVRSAAAGEVDSIITEDISVVMDESKEAEEPNVSDSNQAMKSAADCAPPKKTPTGCVGAYRRAVAQATKRLVELVKEERLKNYKSLDEEEQRRLGTALLDACSSDDGLQEVKNIVKRGIDVEDFYVASDGTETSALHAAAFHGCSSILEYLCQGLQEEEDQDGGLCNVDLKDSNGWTAMHFAAGANSTQSVRILANHNADLSVEAANGYTPLHWSVRLQNTAVEEELRKLLAERNVQKNKNEKSMFPSPPDLSRFFFGGTVQPH